MVVFVKLWFILLGVYNGFLILFKLYLLWLGDEEWGGSGDSCGE